MSYHRGGGLLFLGFLAAPATCADPLKWMTRGQSKGPLQHFNIPGLIGKYAQDYDVLFTHFAQLISMVVHLL